MTSRVRASVTHTSRRASTPRTFPRPPSKVSEEQYYNPSHRHSSCQSWVIIAGTQASLRHFVIVTLIILKVVFLGKDIWCCTVNSKKQLLEAQWMLLLCSLLAMIYKWESICYNWVSSRLTSLIFCCSSSASPHPPCLAFSEAPAFLALCDNWIKIFFWQPEYCSVAFLSTAYLGYIAFTVSHNTLRSLNCIMMMTGYLSENFKGFGNTMNAL